MGHLAFHVSNPRSKLYQDAEDHVLAHLHTELKKLVETYTPLSSMQIFEAATAPRVASTSAAASGNGFKEEVSEMATRMAHIGILHWRVWAPLAYLVDPDAEEEQSSNSERAKACLEYHQLRIETNSNRDCNKSRVDERSRAEDDGRAKRQPTIYLTPKCFIATVFTYY